MTRIIRPESMVYLLSSVALVGLSAVGPVSFADDAPTVEASEQERDWDKIDPPIEPDIIMNTVFGGGAGAAVRGALRGAAASAKKAAETVAKEWAKGAAKQGADDVMNGEVDDGVAALIEMANRPIVVQALQLRDPSRDGGYRDRDGNYHDPGKVDKAVGEMNSGRMPA